MTTVLTWLGFAVGATALAITATSIVVTLIVPRGVRSRLTRLVELTTGQAWLRIALIPSTYEARDRLLALLAPLQLITLLAVWIACFLIAYALILWPFAGGFDNAVRFSGSALFTLGFLTSDPDAAVSAISFAAAATGLVVVALQIAYLPTLYGAYNRRETLVTMLESRGGAPVWGPEILARHSLVDIIDNLPDFYADWERWAADLAESHTNYPVLLYFRSPHPRRGFAIALIAVLDAAAMHHALCPDTSPSECRLVLRMGFSAFREIASALGIRFDPDPRPDDPIMLTREEFVAAVEHLRSTGFPIERTAEEAWPHFRGWRVNYEATAWAIADRVLSPPALWAGPRPRLGIRVAPAPVRPVDRRPGDERVATLEQSRRRRALRGAGVPEAGLPAGARRMLAMRALRALEARDAAAAEAVATGEPLSPAEAAEAAEAASAVAADADRDGDAHRRHHDPPGGD